VVGKEKAMKWMLKANEKQFSIASSFISITRNRRSLPTIENIVATALPHAN
jgi:hypothetical protein